MADTLDRKASVFIDQNHNKRLRVTDVLSSNQIKLEGSDRIITLIGIVAFEEFGKNPALGKVQHPLAPGYPNQTDQNSTAFAQKLKNQTVLIHSPRRDVFNPDKIITGFPLQQKDGSLGAIIYLSNGESWQEQIVKAGYAYYNNRMEADLSKLLPLSGTLHAGNDPLRNPGKNFSRILYDAEREARTGIDDEGSGKPKGIWQEKFASGPGSAVLMDFIQKWGKQSKILTLFDKNEYPDANYLPPRYQTKGSIERTRRVAERRRRQASDTANTRNYSDTPIGSELRRLSEKYLPEDTSLEIIRNIIAGNMESSITQIGALWCGIPTAEQTRLGIKDSTSHVASISEMRKDGDIQTILGQGFIQSAMGERPPFEGITMTLIVEPDGVENFLVPLVTQCRIDPIIPVRNLHLARFARPLMSYKPFYSDIFGALPAFLKNDEKKVVQPSELQLLNYLYLSVPVYLAVSQIQIENYTTSAGSFIVTINANVTDVTTTYGKYPIYAKTIDQAFQIQRQRVQMADRMSTKQMIQDTAAELALTPIQTPNDIEKPDVAFTNITAALEKHYQKAERITLVAKDGKLIRIPETITTSEIRKQLTKEKQVIRGQDTKLVMDSYLHYRAASGPRENKGFLRNIGVIGTNLPSGPAQGNDLITKLVRLRGFPFPNGASFVTRAEVTDPAVLGTEPNSALNKNIGFLIGISEVERAFATTCDIPAKITRKEELFNKAGPFTAYPSGYKNLQEETVLGFDGAQVIEPFELIMTNQAENGPGSVLTNLDVEFACSYGLPVISLTREGGVYRTKLITVTNGNTANPQILNSSIEGNIEQRGTRVTVLSKKQTGAGGDTNATFNAYYEALKASVVEGAVTFVPEITSSAMYRSTAPDPEFATIRFSDYSSFPMRVSDVGKTTADANAVGSTFKLSAPANKTNGGVGIIASGQSFPRQKRQSLVLPIEVWTIQTYETGNPLTFKIRNPDATRVNATSTFTLKGVGVSSKGRYIFVGTATTSGTAKLCVFVSKKRQSEILSTLSSYIGEKGTARKKDYAKSSDYLMIKALFDSVRASSSDPVTPVRKTNALRNVIQAIDATKAINGTRFLDESEPYFYSLMYQIGAVNENVFDVAMTFKVRPDRVPYKPLTDKQATEDGAAIISIRRIGRPNLTDQGPTNDIQREVARAERILNDVATAADLNRKVGEYIIDEARRINPDNWKLLVSDKRMALLGMQSLLIDLVYPLIITAMTQKAGAVVNRKLQTGKNLSATATRELGLADKDMLGQVNAFRDQLLNQLINVKVAREGKTPQDKYILDLSQRQLNQLTLSIRSGTEILTTSKTPTGKSYFSVETIVRLMVYGTLDFGKGQDKSTAALLTDLIQLYGEIVQKGYDAAWIAKKENFNVLVTSTQFANQSTPNGTFNIQGALFTRLAQIVFAAKETMVVLRAIRVATGNDFGLSEVKEIKKIPPIPRIAVVEQYGISEPIMAAGSKKPRFQVVGSSAMVVSMDLQTDTENLFLGKLSVIKTEDIKIAEEGADALYNLIREPGEEVTVYNMLKSGRALDRKRIINSNTPNVITGDVSAQTLATDFRLVRRAVSIGLESEALASALGHSSAHIEVREPLLLALGMYRFVAKSTQIRSDSETQSWIMTLTLVPHEATYTTNRNLRKLNTSVSNENVADIGSWIAASYDFDRAKEVEKDTSTLKEKDPVALSVAAKVMGTRVATAHYFAGLVMCHAIAHGKAKLFSDSAFSYTTDATLVRDQMRQEDGFNQELQKTINSRIQEKMAMKVFVEAAYTNSIPAVGSNEVGRLTYPYTPELSLLTTAGNVVAPLVGGYAGQKAGAALSKVNWSSRFLRGAGSFLGKRALPLLGDIGVILADMYTSRSELQPLSKVIKDDEEVLLISLTEDFIYYGINFLIDFAYAESKGVGREFIERIASEAQQVISAAGDFGSAQLFGTDATTVNAAGAIDTNAHYLKAIYPAPAAVRKITEKKDNNTRFASKVTLMVVNFANSGHVEDAWTKTTERVAKRYHEWLRTTSSSGLPAMSPIDVCGEEVMQLLLDGQLSMSRNILPGLMTIPASLMQDLDFHYAMSRTIFGRLKLNVFAMGMLDQTFVKAKSLPLELLGNGVISKKRTTHHDALRKAGLSYDPQKKRLSFVANENGLNALADGIITGKIPTAAFATMPFPVFTKIARTAYQVGVSPFGADVFYLQLIESAKTCYQLASTDTKQKIGQLPKTEVLFVYDGENQLDKRTHTACVESAKQYLKVAIGCILQESHGLTVDGYLRNDLVSILSNGIVEVLAREKQKDLGIEEAEAIALVRSNPQLYDLSQGTNENTEQLRRALDKAVLYTTGDARARQAALGEYSMFLSALRSILLQQMNPQESADVSTDEGEYGAFLAEANLRYANTETKEQVRVALRTIREQARSGGFSSADRTANTAAEKGPWTTIHHEIPGIEYGRDKRGVVLPGSLFFQNRGRSATSLFGNQQETVEMMTALGFLFRTSHGITNPLYVPSIMMAGYLHSDGKLYILKTPVTNATQAFQSIRKAPAWWSQFLASAIRVTTDELGIIGGIVIGLLILIFSVPAGAAIIIGTVVWAIAGFFLKFSLARLALTIEPWRMEAVSQLQSPVPISTMFVGAKILNDIVGSINFVDIERITLWPTDVARQVAPPNIEDDLFETGYILNDTLAYLTLPLLMRRNAAHVRDILPPGGIVVPDFSTFNTKSEALIDGLVTNSFLFEDEYNNLPQYMEQMARLAIETQAPGILHEFGIPTTDSELKRFGSAKDFLRVMSEIFIADSGMNPTLEQTTKDLNLYGSMIVGLEFLHAYTLGRKLKNDRRDEDNKKILQEVKASASKIGLPVGSFSLTGSTADISQVAEDNLSFFMPNYTSQWVLSTTSVSATEGKPRLKAPFTKSTVVHSTNLSSEPTEFPVSTSDVELVGMRRDQSNQVFQRKTPFFLRHEVSPQFSSVTSVTNVSRQNELEKANAEVKRIQSQIAAAQILANDAVKKKLPDAETKQNQLNQLAQELIQARELANRLAKAPVTDETGNQTNMGILLNFLGITITGSTYAIVSKQSAQSTSLFDSRNLYNVLENYAKTGGNGSQEFRSRVTKTSEHLLKYAQLLVNSYNPETIMIWDARGVYQNPGLSRDIHDAPFLLAAAIKNALDEEGGASGASPLNLKVKHIVAALVSAADFLWYLNFLCDETEKQRSSINDPAQKKTFPTTAWLKEPGKVSLLKKVEDSADVKLANSGGSNSEITSRMAAKMAVSSNYILGKIGDYLDPKSTGVIRGLKRVQDTTLEALMAPLQNYPVAKLYFIERNKGVITLFDDLYGYADVMKVDIFDSWKDPETTAIIELSNTENKLDNILLARNQSENPFETRARNTDPLSGILLKSGTRMQTYLGYGNVLTEDEKYLFEIGSVNKTPDNKTVILGKGPGWVLKTPMGRRPNVPKEITFENIKTVFRRQSGITLGATGSESSGEVGDVTEVLQESAPAVARSLIIYGLSVIGSVDGFGRLGSKLPFGSDVMLSRLPESYATQGMGDSAITYVADLFKRITYKSLFGSTFGLDNESTDVGIAAISNQANSFEINIKLSPFIGGASNSAFANIAANVIARFQDIAATVLLSDAPAAIWRFNNETHYEFIKSVLMNIPNHRFFVRSYGTDGSMVMGTKDEYYSLFPPRSLESLLVQRYVEEQKIDLSLKSKATENIRRLRNSFVKAYTDPNARKAVAELIVATLSTYAIASDSHKLVVEKILSQIAPAVGTTLATISTNDGVFIPDIRTLYDAIADSPQTMDIVCAAILQQTGLSVSEKTINEARKELKLSSISIDTILKAYALVASLPVGTEIAAGTAVKDALAPKSANAISTKEAADTYKALRNNSNAEKEKDKSTKVPVDTNLASERLGNIVAFVAEAIPDYFKSAQVLGSAGAMPVSFAGFLPDPSAGKDMTFLYALVLTYHQMINVRVARLQALAPESRPFYMEHKAFSEFDIVANNATTMVGFNEFNFTFEKATKFAARARGLQILANAGSKVTDLVRAFVSPGSENASTATESEVYSINPVARRNSYDGYESIRTTISLVNPDYFGRIQGVNYPSYLNILASEQMSEMVRDWYGGMISLFGKAKMRPMDGVYLHDSINDMYGPTDIKELVHSFSQAGFISTYVPSVSVHVDSSSLGEAPGLSTFRWIDAIAGVLIAGLTYKVGGRVAARGLRQIGATGKLTRLAGRLDRFARGSVAEMRQAFANPGITGKIKGVRDAVKTFPKLVAAGMIKTPFIGLESILKNLIDTNGRQVLMQFAKREAKNIRDAASLVKIADVFSTPEGQKVLQGYEVLIQNKKLVENVTPELLIRQKLDSIQIEGKEEVIQKLVAQKAFENIYGAQKNYLKALNELEEVLKGMKAEGAPAAKLKGVLDKLASLEADVIKQEERIFQTARIEGMIIRQPLPGGGDLVDGMHLATMHIDAIRAMSIKSSNKNNLTSYIKQSSERTPNPLEQMNVEDLAFSKRGTWATEAGDISTRVEGFNVPVTARNGIRYPNMRKVMFESEGRALMELDALEKELAKGLDSISASDAEALTDAIGIEKRRILDAVEDRAKQLTSEGTVDGTLNSALRTDYEPFKVKTQSGSWVDDPVQGRSKNAVSKLADSLNNQKVEIEVLNAQNPGKGETLFVEGVLKQRDDLLTGAKSNEEIISITKDITKKLSDSLGMKGDSVADIIFNVASDKASIHFADDLKNPLIGGATNAESRNIHGDVARMFLDMIDGNPNPAGKAAEAAMEKALSSAQKTFQFSGVEIEESAVKAAAKLFSQLEKDLRYQGHKAQKVAAILSEVKEALKKKPMSKELLQIIQETAEAQKQSKQNILQKAKQAITTGKNKGVAGAIKDVNAATAPEGPTVDVIKNQIIEDIDKIVDSPQMEESLLRYINAMVDGETKTALQEGVIAYAQTRAKSGGAATPAAKKKEFLAFFNTVNDVRSQGFQLSSSRGTTLKRSLGIYASIVAGYGAVRELVGGPAEEYFARLSSEQVAKSIRASFLNLKGEPYISNLEGLTKDAMLAIGGTESYSEVVKSRYFDFVTREGRSVIFDTVQGLVKNVAGTYFDIRQPVSDVTPLTEMLRPNAGSEGNASARVNDFIGQGSAKLDVPYLSQLKNRAPIKNISCQVTSLAMILQRAGYNVSPDELYERGNHPTMREWAQSHITRGSASTAQTWEYFNAKNAFPEAFVVLRKMFNDTIGVATVNGESEFAKGFTIPKEESKAIAFIREEIQKGYPVFVGGNFWPDNGGHDIVVIGYNEEGLIVHDPWGVAPSYKEKNGSGIVYTYEFLRTGGKNGEPCIYGKAGLILHPDKRLPAVRPN